MILLLLLAVGVLGFLLHKHTLRIRIQELKTEFKDKEKAIRKDALSRSRSVRKGQAMEHMAPFMLPDIEHKDIRFIGGVVDLIVFKNLDAGSEDVEIYMVDVKTNQSSLSKRQRTVRDAVIANKVKFATYNPDKKEFRVYGETNE